MYAICYITYLLLNSTSLSLSLIPIRTTLGKLYESCMYGWLRKKLFTQSLLAFGESYVFFSFFLLCVSFHSLLLLLLLFSSTAIRWAYTFSLSLSLTTPSIWLGESERECHPLRKRLSGTISAFTTPVHTFSLCMPVSVCVYVVFHTHRPTLSSLCMHAFIHSD